MHKWIGFSILLAITSVAQSVESSPTRYSLDSNQNMSAEERRNAYFSLDLERETGDVDWQMRDLSLVSATGGAINDVQVENGYAYCATGYGFAAFESSDLSQTAPVSTLLLQNAAVALKVQNHYAYVAARFSGLKIIDISDPYHPFIAAEIEDINATAIDIRDTVAFVGNAFWGVRLYDIANPLFPTLISTYLDNWGGWDYAIAVKVRQDNMFVSVLEDVVHVVDISNLSTPAFVAMIERDNVESIAFYEDTLILSGWDGLSIYNAATPDSVIELWTSSLEATEAEVHEHYLLLTGRDSLSILDIASPDQPLSVAQIPHAYRVYAGSGGTFGAETVGQQTFVATGSGGLQIFDVSDVTSPQQVFQSELPGLPKSISIQDQVCYMTDPSLGLVSLDISDPTHPVLLDYCVTPGYTSNLHVEQNYAYACETDAGLQIIDISNPDNLQPIHHLSFPGNYVQNVDVSEAVLYVATGSNGLHILDITTPEAPVTITTVPGEVGDVIVQGNFAFLAARGEVHAGIRVLDISSPAVPLDLGFYPADYDNLLSYPENLTIDGDYAYLAGFVEGLFIYDISDPYDVELVGFGGDSVRYVKDVAIHGSNAFAAVEGGIQILDVNDPTQPILRNSFWEIPGRTDHVAVWDDLIFVPASQAGFYVYALDISGIEEPNPLIYDVTEQIQNYPNPFQFRTTISFTLNQTSTVTVSIYDGTGRLIRELVGSQVREPGMNSIWWDGIDKRGRQVPPGRYLYQIKINNIAYSGQMTVIR